MTKSIKLRGNPANQQGRFEGGNHRPLMAMVEITGRCNMACPICFAGSIAPGNDIPLEEVKNRIRTLLHCAGPIPLQISGGEPTLHPDLPIIISYARHLGFKNIELVTNGIEISNNSRYLMLLVEKGLSAVYLQFDGLAKETYLKIRGRDMSDVRRRAISTIRKAKICCTLAVAVTRHINDHELGDIVRFGIANIDTVRAINFQAAARFTGRFDIADSGEIYSTEELVDLIETQLDLDKGGFLTGILGHHQCNALSLLYVVDGRVEPLFRYLSNATIKRFLGNDKRQTILDLFMGKERFVRKYLLHPKTWKILSEAAAIFGNNPSIKSILQAKHILIFTKSFMEKETFNSNRLQECCYGLATSDGVYSFCAYNNFHRFPSEK